MSKAPERRTIRCYLCGHSFEVSAKAMSVPCPRCHRALKIENVEVKSYVPVNDLQTCGSIHVAKNGRVVARIIQSGDGINCEGTLEGMIHTDGPMSLGSKSTWKGAELCTHTLRIEDGAKILGRLTVPWIRPADERKSPMKPIPEPAAPLATPAPAEPAASQSHVESESQSSEVVSESSATAMTPASVIEPKSRVPGTAKTSAKSTPDVETSASDVSAQVEQPATVESESSKPETSPTQPAEGSQPASDASIESPPATPVKTSATRRSSSKSSSPASFKPLVPGKKRK